MASDILNEMAEKAGIEVNESQVAKPDFDQDNAGRYVAYWKSDNIRIIVEAPDRKHLEFWCMITVLWQPETDTPPRTLMHRKRWNMRSGSGTSEHVRALKGQNKHRDWAGRLEWVAYLVDQMYSTGEPMAWLDKTNDPGPILYLANPLLEQGEHNIIFADGSSTKSFLAMAMCVSYATGKSIVPGVHVTGQGNALYLDWEASKESQRRRFQRFTRNTTGVAYKRMVSPLVDVADELAQMIEEHKFGLVVCDSASMASGGEIVDEAMVAAFFRACRSFNTTILTLCHVPKGGERDRPIGSTYWYNQCRVAWELVKEQVEGDPVAHLDLIQRKSNNDAMHRPFGLQLDFSGEQTVYRMAEAGGADESRLPLATRIRQYLLENGKATVSEIAEHMGKTPVRVTNLLRSQEGRMFISDQAKKDRLWWVLPASSLPPKVTSKDGEGGFPLKGNPHPTPKETLPLKTQVDTPRIKSEEVEDLPW